MKYGISKPVNLTYEEAVSKVTEELKKEGFGVLTTIDVKETLKKKLDVDFDKYIILGACNPPYAYKALQAEYELGLILPCNVIVYEKDGKVTVSAFDSMVMAEIIDNPKLREIALEVREKIERVIQNV
ncbi:Uncharacterized conserved protein, DUF302 family [Candidatus Kryptonium thompsonii]|uniref:Uncharacterized conserved protein, DUF302 family n=1 Tax=Candidatus Kryptonium thompsonii TaxID=1633631 RepID=A0A0P1MCZ8_9BACT|nr:DUF302 domain-containing protein [Candidatus Kryptonium thompsoni]CUS77473.1 Uncharacterized conserved protein, DUF302 family [Candidatus Kryptonium thompsoni]CUS90851.1 Uncharacterized conserved protein, DUF302 family [Candidatus Kryptonium thompsoni]CUS93316.1 Uncharacterized conserved protein, DUF302 family [Candidatus Kryptonium thompsoni]CUT02659.1 Uncharacterized conserved protein, DUF302 family [Candidatus Kryptonium thompsoni]CUT08068.1 Uncharacterized conserved protein, DUF302 fami